MQEALANISQMSIVNDLVLPALQGLICGLIVLYIVYSKQGFKKLGITGAICTFIGGLTLRFLGAFIVGLVFVMLSVRRKNQEAEEARLKRIAEEIDEMSNTASEEKTDSEIE